MPLTQPHKDALKAFEAAQKNLQQFLETKGDELHLPRVYQEGQQLRENVKSLKDDLERHVGAEQLRRDANDFGSYLNDSDKKSLTPAGSRPFEAIGTTAAGHAVVDTATRRYLEDVGPGTFNQKTWDAIQNPAYAKAFKEMLKSGQRMSEWAYKNLDLGFDASAGYLAPIDWQQRLIQRMATPTRLSGMVTNVNTSRDAIVMPKVNYAGNSTDDPAGNLYNTPFRVTWTGSRPTSDTQSQVNDTSLFGTTRIDIFTAMIEGTLTNDMVEDAALDVQGWAEGGFGLTVDLLRDNMILNGTGNQQPTGLGVSVGSWSGGAVTADGQVPVIQTANAGAVVGDDLINLAYDVPEQYEDSLTWVFNKTRTMKAIRTLKDSQNRYLFGQGYNDSGLVAGKPTDLVGYKYNYSGFAPNIASGNTPIYFGDFRGIYMANRLGFYVRALNEVMARQNLIVLLGRVRFGAKPVEPWRLRALLVQ